MARNKKVLWLALIFVLAAATWWVIDGLEKEMQTVDVVTDDDLLTTDALAGLLENDDWGYDESGAFFVEYRLQRDRVRDQEKEVLEGIIDNPNATQTAKEEAESMLLELVRLMEQELLVESMIKAQGFDDAIFFYRNRAATVMVKKRELSEGEFVQITDTVAGVVDVAREDVHVISRP